MLISSHAFAQDNDSNDLPWKRSAIEFGYFLTTLNSNLRIGTGVGIDIDVEEILGMDSSQSLFRFKFFRRFTENKRHRFDLSWVSLHRTGDNQIARDITVEGPDGNEIEIKAGTKVESFLNLDIFKGVYSYSLFLDDRLDLALEFGLYVMPIEFGLTAEGAINYDNDENINPLESTSEFLWFYYEKGVYHEGLNCPCGILFYLVDCLPSHNHRS